MIEDGRAQKTPGRFSPGEAAPKAREEPENEIVSRSATAAVWRPNLQSNKK
jgi:hypothetical protein